MVEGAVKRPRPRRSRASAFFHRFTRPHALLETMQPGLLHHRLGDEHRSPCDAEQRCSDNAGCDACSRRTAAYRGVALTRAPSVSWTRSPERLKAYARSVNKRGQGRGLWLAAHRHRQDGAAWPWSWRLASAALGRAAPARRPLLELRSTYDDDAIRGRAQSRRQLSELDLLVMTPSPIKASPAARQALPDRQSPLQRRRATMVTTDLDYRA